MDDNMKLWNKVCKSDPKTLKLVEYGTRKFTVIDAQTQIKKVTETFGICGDGWGVSDENYTVINDYCFYTANFFFRMPGDPPGEPYRIPIHSDIEIIFKSGKAQGKYNEDWSKKIATDALTKGFSRLGFNSDVFEGKWLGNKYVGTEENTKERSIKEQIESVKNDILLMSQDSLFSPNAINHFSGKVKNAESQLDNGKTPSDTVVLMRLNDILKFIEKELKDRRKKTGKEIIKE